MQATMSRSGILEALCSEEQSLRTSCALETLACSGQASGIEEPPFRARDWRLDRVVGP